MKLVLHLVWNDLRRLRAWVLLWSVLLVAMDALGFSLLLAPGLLGSRESDSKWTHVGTLQDGLLATEVLVAYLLMIFSIQGDRLLGSAGFWRTRPISGERMLAAKFSTGVCLLVLLPGVVSLPWWWYCGLSLREMGAAVIQIARTALVVGTLGALVGALTDSLRRALLWGLVVVPCLVGTVAVAVDGDVGFEVRHSLTGFAAVGLIALALQFAGRRTGLALTALMIAMLWLPDWYRQRNADYWDWRDDTAPAFRISVQRAGVNRSTSWQTGVVSATLALKLSTDGVPADMFVVGGTSVVSRN